MTPELACHHCKSSVTKALVKKTLAKRIKKCSQPWLFKWPIHREIEKVKVHKNVIEYLYVTIVDGDELIDTFVYGKAHNMAATNEKCIASDIHNDATHIKISDELSADNSIATIVNDIKLLEHKLLEYLKFYDILKGVTDSSSTLISLENKCQEFLGSDLFCSDKEGKMIL